MRYWDLSHFSPRPFTDRIHLWHRKATTVCGTLRYLRNSVIRSKHLPEKPKRIERFDASSQFRIAIWNHEQALVGRWLPCTPSKSVQGRQCEKIISPTHPTKPRSVPLPSCLFPLPSDCWENLDSHQHASFSSHHRTWATLLHMPYMAKRPLSARWQPTGALSVPAPRPAEAKPGE